MDSLEPGRRATGESSTECGEVSTEKCGEDGRAAWIGTSKEDDLMELGRGEAGREPVVAADVTDGWEN